MPFSSKYTSQSYPPSSLYYVIIRTEILSTHIPNENDEWMKLECRLLTQCTRIFPPEPKANDGKAGEDEGEFGGKEEEENEDNDTEGQQEQKMKKEGSGGSAMTATTTATVKSKTASYEDIIFKVFLEDRRMMYRKFRPLPHRVKTEEGSAGSSGSFLPPLDPPASSRSSFSSMVSLLLTPIISPLLSFSLSRYCRALERAWSAGRLHQSQ